MGFDFSTFIYFCTYFAIFLICYCYYQLRIPHQITMLRSQTVLARSVNICLHS